MLSGVYVPICWFFKGQHHTPNCQGETADLVRNFVEGCRLWRPTLETSGLKIATQPVPAPLLKGLGFGWIFYPQKSKHRFLGTQNIDRVSRPQQERSSGATGTWGIKFGWWCGPSVCWSFLLGKWWTWISKKNCPKIDMIHFSFFIIFQFFGSYK